MYKWRKKIAGIAPSHTLMDGGLFYVPIGKSDEFFEDYVSCIQNSKLFVTELKTPRFRFFMDIDYIGETGLSDDQILDVARDIHKHIPGRCIVAITQPKKCKNAIKSGIHMHWPDLIVDSREAQNMIKNLKNPFIDPSVYKGSGLRMLWSYKKGACGDEEPYVPFMELPDTRLDPTPSVKLLELCSIRVGPDPMPRVQTVVSSTIEEFIQKCMMNEIRFRGVHVSPDFQVSVKKVSKKKNTMVIQTSSKLCLYKKSEHQSNHVYFVVDLDRYIMHQRCHDEGCTGFKGMCHSVPKHIINELKELSIDK